MKIDIRKLSSENVSELIDLLRIFDLVFEEDNSNNSSIHHLNSLLQKRALLFFVAVHTEKVVGGMTVHLLDQYNSPLPLAYIYDLGVHPDYQRQGIGKALILYLNNYCRQNGIQEAYVDADATDFQAINFYRSTGIFRELPTIQFTYVFPGDDC